IKLTAVAVPSGYVNKGTGVVAEASEIENVAKSWVNEQNPWGGVATTLRYQVQGTPPAANVTTAVPVLVTTG
ncbi:hypothetical protein ABXW34_24280, partial [Streptococcus suis]